MKVFRLAMYVRITHGGVFQGLTSLTDGVGTDFIYLIGAAKYDPFTSSMGCHFGLLFSGFNVSDRCMIKHIIGHVCNADLLLCFS